MSLFTPDLSPLCALWDTWIPKSPQNSIISSALLRGVLATPGVESGD